MRLASFEFEGVVRAGVIEGDAVADLSAVSGGPTSVQELIAATAPVEAANALLDRAPRRPLSEVKLCAPIAHPPKFLAIGLNTRDHRKEVTAKKLLKNLSLVRLGLGYKLAHPRSDYPFFFAKATSSVSGPFDPIWVPRDTDTTDWEGELAFVVGRRCRHLNPEQARGAIAGYMVTNDVSVRGLQFDNPTGPMLAKGYETHGPTGPWLVTPDEVDPADLELRTFVNGELKQRGRIDEMVLSPSEILSVISDFCTLEAGDIVACGTFAGVGWLSGEFLKPGDVVRVEIDGLGAIENPVIAEPLTA